MTSTNGIEYNLRKWRDIYYCLIVVSDVVCWALSDREDITRSTLYWYPCDTYRIDQAIDHFLAEINYGLPEDKKYGQDLSWEELHTREIKRLMIRQEQRFIWGISN